MERLERGESPSVGGERDGCVRSRLRGDRLFGDRYDESMLSRSRPGNESEGGKRALVGDEEVSSPSSKEKMSEASTADIATGLHGVTVWLLEGSRVSSAQKLSVSALGWMVR